jgi:capsular polysaccharide biosynthesis protein
MDKKKSKEEKHYDKVAEKVAKMFSKNPTEDEALAQLRALPRKDRRIVQRFFKKSEEKAAKLAVEMEKVQHEEIKTDTGNPSVS